MKTWNPWTITGGTLQLAEWPEHEPGSVLVEVDVFEPFDGPARRTGPGSGERIWVCTVCRCGFADTRGPCTYCARMMVPAGSADCLQELFRHIDAHPQTHYTLQTLHPERVREAWPAVPEVCDDSWCDGSGKSCPGCGNCVRYRPNVTLSLGPLATQADADRLADLCGNVELNAPATPGEGES